MSKKFAIQISILLLLILGCIMIIVFLPREKTIDVKINQSQNDPVESVGTISINKGCANTYGDDVISKIEIPQKNIEISAEAEMFIQEGDYARVGKKIYREGDVTKTANFNSRLINIKKEDGKQILSFLDYDSITVSLRVNFYDYITLIGSYGQNKGFYYTGGNDYDKLSVISAKFCVDYYEVTARLNRLNFDLYNGSDICIRVVIDSTDFGYIIPKNIVEEINGQKFVWLWDLQNRYQKRIEVLSEGKYLYRINYLDEIPNNCLLYVTQKTYNVEQISDYFAQNKYNKNN